MGMIGGMFGFLDFVLDALGKGVALLLFGKRATHGKASYAWVGAGTAGASIGIIFGLLQPFVDSGSLWHPGPPSTGLSALVGFVGGMLAGAFIGFFISSIDRTIKEAFPDT
jgi:hypothetical protein